MRCARVRPSGKELCTIIALGFGYILDLPSFEMVPDYRFMSTSKRNNGGVCSSFIHALKINRVSARRTFKTSFRIESDWISVLSEVFVKMKGGNGWLAAMKGSNWIIMLIVSFVTLILARLLYVLYKSGKPLRPKTSEPLRTLIVLGSGGHTAEMLNLLLVLQKDRFAPRYYIAAATDNMSLQKAQTFESSATHVVCFQGSGNAQYMQIYRSREVGQSYITSVFTTLIAIAHAVWLMIKIRPQVILCNGPGTCIPLCAIAFVFKVLGIRWSSIFYVESIARVKRLSLSGLLLYKLRMTDQLYVQWPPLQKMYPGSIYVGCLM